MLRHLTNFDKHSNYDIYITGTNKIYPNVSYCQDNNEVHYNINYKTKYFTIKSLQNGNIISWKATHDDILKTISVSLDNGNTWTDYTSSIDDNGTVIATLNKGEKLIIKGTNATYGTYVSSPAAAHYNNIICSKKFIVQGNAMSLVNGDDFVDKVVLTGTYTFYYLFNNSTNLIHAKNLILPATTLTNACYAAMFNGCSNLNYIKAMFTTDPNSGSYTSSWVYGVATDGTFVKNADATWTLTGSSGIPTRWTVQTATS